MYLTILLISPIGPPIVVAPPMGTTAHEMIRDAALLIHVIDPLEQLDAQEAIDGLNSLNQLIESVSLDSLNVYQINQENFPLTPGIGSYTIGPTGTFVTTRPATILPGSYIKEAGIDYPLWEMTRTEFDRISQKLLSYRPEYFYYEPSVPNGKIFLWQVPAVGSGIFLNSEKLLSQFPDLTTPIALAPGYRRWLTHILAMEIAPQYKKAISQDVKDAMLDARMNVQRKNERIEKLQLEHSDFGSHGRGNTRSDFMAGY